MVCAAAGLENRGARRTLCERLVNPLSNRLKLVRSDGRIYLKRWGLACRFGGVFVHHIGAPDPGPDLHDHPFWWVSWVVKGNYTECRASAAQAVARAQMEVNRPELRVKRGDIWHRPRWSVAKFKRTECHMITECKPDTWTILVRGPRRRKRPGGEYWGFYTPTQYYPEGDYDRLGARDLMNEVE
jgi:hypothetical protein